MENGRYTQEEIDKYIEDNCNSSDPETVYDNFIFRMHSERYFNSAYKYYKDNQNTIDNFDLKDASYSFLLLLVTLKKDDEALDLVSYYQNLPYVNQETEEQLRDLNHIVLNMIKQRDYVVNEKNIKTVDYYKEKLGNAKNHAEITELVSEIAKNFDFFTADEVLEIFEFAYDKHQNNEKNASYFVFILIIYKSKKNVVLSKDGKVYSFIPIDKTEENNISMKVVNDVANDIRMSEKNMTVSSISRSYTDTIGFYIVPEFLTEKDKQNFEAAVLYVANSMAGEDYKLDPVYQSLTVDEEQMKIFIKKLEDCID
jgi:hypothetical protein